MARCLTAPLRWGSTKGWISVVMGLAYLNMFALVHDSPDRAVTAIEPLTGSDNFATWKRLMTSYLEARQVWEYISR
jgi:hypothetical protein